MPRYFLHLAYCGASFHGWQIQPGASSVQQSVEQALSMILRKPVSVVGAGRTDAGVNARCMVAHADLDVSESTAVTLARKVNAICGPDITVYSLTKVHDEAHARFDATSRTYRYYVNLRRSPFTGAYSWHSPAQLDFRSMNIAAAELLVVDDFTSFAKLHSDARTNICHVTKAEWSHVGGDADIWYFEITADRFLRNMVRAVVGTLIDVGRGKLSLEEWRRVIDRHDRCAAGTSMPPYALYLWNVAYSYYQPVYK